jgi:hypothetical protein
VTAGIRPLLLAAILVSTLLGACSSAPLCAGKVSKTHTEPLRLALPAAHPQAVDHWASQQQGDTCARAPGPIDWHYQDVVVLNSADVTALTEHWHWRDATEPDPNTDWDWTDLAQPADLWPQLATYLPAGATWIHSDDYDRVLPPNDRWNVAFLDTADKILLMFSFDH